MQELPAHEHLQSCHFYTNNYCTSLTIQQKGMLSITYLMQILNMNFFLALIFLFHFASFRLFFYALHLTLILFLF